MCKLGHGIRGLSHLSSLFLFLFCLLHPKSAEEAISKDTSVSFVEVFSASVRCFKLHENEMLWQTRLMHVKQLYTVTKDC